MIRNMKRIKNIQKKRQIILIVLMMIICLEILKFRIVQNSNVKEETVGNNDNTELINSKYNTYVITNKESMIYQMKNSQMILIGTIQQGVELTLDGIMEEYFLIKNLDDMYYIKYKDVEKINNLSNLNERYKKYLPFNKNIITKETTNFYDEEDNLVYSFNKSFNIPIIIKEEERYGVEYAGKLLYIQKQEVIKEEDNNNTTETNTSAIAVLNYHFIYLESEECNEILCVSENQFRSHLDYITENNFFTPTMQELEMYIDEKINLPKSVVITVDDGAFAQNVKNILDEYQLNGTLFLITSWFNPKDFESEYLEIASHGDNLHNVGVCPGGQGGAIKCMEHDKLLADLQSSREKLNNSTYFCYPFYEYNDYSISVLKEAGFTMSFAGERENGKTAVETGINKYRIPRWVIVNYTTMDTFISYLNNNI